MEEDNTLDAYPKGNYVVASGSILKHTGFKFWGPFDTMRSAVEWVDSKGPLIGSVTIVEVQPPEEF